jgi:hypothetical protein
VSTLDQKGTCYFVYFFLRRTDIFTNTAKCQAKNLQTYISFIKHILQERFEDEPQSSGTLSQACQDISNILQTLVLKPLDSFKTNSNRNPKFTVTSLAIQQSTIDKATVTAFMEVENDTSASAEQNPTTD